VFKRTIISALLLAAVTPPMAAANSFIETGKALPRPPSAYIDMCLREPNSIACHNPDLSTGTNTAINLWMLNKQINNQIQPIEDIDNYGISDYWTTGRTTGDCEDYVFAKREALIKRGFDANRLSLAVVMYNGEGHAVLVVRTDQADVVLDNVTDSIKTWNKTNYKFLWMQQFGDPNTWKVVK